MAVLIACEESQIVTNEFRKMGIETYSCDLLPTSGYHPEWHIQADAMELCKLKWDAVIAFPPCTHLAVSGASHFEQKRKDGRQYLGIGFFLYFTQLNHIPFVAIENPVGIMSNIYRKPDQIIQPYQFGEPESKKTCLWLKNLPKLEPTRMVMPETIKYKSNGKTDSKWHYETLSLSPFERSKARSKTYKGIACAMAKQWGKIILDRVKYMP